MSKLSDLLNKLCPNGVCYEKLGNLVEIVRGRRVTKDQIKGCTKYPVFQNSLSHY